MTLATAMLVAYLPFAVWMIRQAKLDFDQSKNERTSK